MNFQKKRCVAMLLAGSLLIFQNRFNFSVG